MSTLTPAVVIDRLSFSWPDAHPVFAGLSATFPQGRTGIIGDNGTGKTTLARLIAGQLHPTGGAIRLSGRLALFNQHAAGSDHSVAQTLGIDHILHALERISSGSTDQADYDLADGNWDIADRTIASLREIGLNADDSWFDRPLASLSGGEAGAVALTGIQRSQAEITLLDEPSNNLDTQARSRLYQMIEQWHGSLIVISHDRELLDHMDAICELTNQGAQMFGGGYQLYQQHKANQASVAERRLREAKSDLALVHRKAEAEQQHQAQRDRAGRRERARGNVGAAEADFFADRAQHRTASAKNRLDKQLASATTALANADLAAKAPETITIELPETTVPTGRQVLALRIGDRLMRIDGPERIRLSGANGSGKTTLLAAATGQIQPYAHQIFGARLELELAPDVPMGFLGQRTDELDGYADCIEAVYAAAPKRSRHDARALLAQLLLKGDKPLQPPASLSGGERLRVALARVLFARPAPQLLVLDEPSNSLDIASVDHLIQSLADYRGALLVVTHDEYLARGLKVHREWSLERTHSGVVIDDHLV